MIKPELNIGIIGCGKMGRDLFEMLISYPFSVSIVCEDEEQVNLIKSRFSKKQERALKYGLIDQATFDFRIENTEIGTEYKLLQTSDLIIEAITEDVQQKRNLFKAIKGVISSNCIVASNSSSISPDQLFSGILNEENCLGLHFFYPVKMKNIVEVNLGEKTSEKTFSTVRKLLQKIDKYYVKLTKKNHFIINRIFLKMQAGCCQILDEGKLDVKEIDAMVKAHLFPVGIFEFFDHVGNDVMLHSVRNYFNYEKDSEFYQPLLTNLEELVKRDRLGIKTNAGFYNYPITNDDSAEDILNAERAIKKINFWYLDGIYDGLNKTGLSESEMAHIVKEYMMIEKSPFDLAKEIGYTHK